MNQTLSGVQRDDDGATEDRDHAGGQQQQPQAQKQPSALVENQEPHKHEPRYLRPLPLAILFVATCLTGSLVLMYVMIIATAIPAITTTFNTVEDLDWYSTAYFLALCAVQPLMARFFDLFPLKAVYLASIGLFEIGNVIGGAAPTSAVFIVGRAVAGLGAAGLFTGILVILTAAAPPKVRPALMGMGMGLTVIGGVVGPLIGGAITDHLGWRWCCWIFLPPGGLAAFVFVFIDVPEQRAKAPPKAVFPLLHKTVDFLGFAMFAPAVIMILLGLSWGGQRYPWKSAVIIGLFCGGGAVSALFATWAWYLQDKALIPPRILKKPVVFCGCGVAFLQIGAFATLGDYLPLWFQSVKQATPTQSGLMLLPTMVTQIIATGVCGILMNKIGYVPPWALTGNVLSAIGSGLMTTFTPSTTEGQWIGYQILTGAGRGLVIQMPAIALQGVLSNEDISIGTATTVFFQYFGSAVFLAVSKSTFLNRLGPALGEYAPDVDPEVIVNAGATGLSAIVAPKDYEGVILAYSSALVTTFWLSAAASIIAFFFSFGLGWEKVTVQMDKMTGSGRDDELLQNLPGTTSTKNEAPSGPSTATQTTTSVER